MSRSDELRGMVQKWRRLSHELRNLGERRQVVDAIVDRADELEALLARTEAAQANSSWSLFDRVDFALRDAGFDFDEASNIAALAAEQEKALAGAHTAKAEAAPVVDGAVAEVIAACGGFSFKSVLPFAELERRVNIGDKLYLRRPVNMDDLEWLHDHLSRTLSSERLDRAHSILSALTNPHDASAMDAERFDFLANRAKQDRAYDVFGNGGHWSIGLHSADGNLSLREAIDAAMSQSGRVMSDKPKKIEPYTDKWEAMANDLARSCVQIKPCRDCGAPVIDGYCCQHCGSRNP